MSDGSELAFYTTDELVTELLRRKTFLGVVVHADNDFRNDHWNDEQVFKVRFNSNLDVCQTSRLLDRIGDYLQERNL
jgi:hypothetical protein